MDKKNIPVYEYQIKDDSIGMYCISLVDDPATLVNWQAFSKEKMNFSVVNGDQHKVIGVLMRANFNMIRKASNGQYFYIRFSPETLDKMAQQFLKKGYQNTINIQHQQGSYIDGVELTQIFIKDSEKGINPKGFENIEEGSLFGVYKIENEEVWEAIKNGVFTGFSIEGYFDAVPYDNTKMSLKDLWDQVRKG